jgi:hypothetical protein
MTVLMLFLMGSRWKHAPMLGIWTQVMWFYYALYVLEDNGLLAGVLAVLFVHVRNLFLWRTDDKR